MTDIFKDGLWRGEIYESELYIQDRVLLLTPSEVQQLFDAFISRCYQPQLFQRLDCVSPDGDKGKTDGGK